MAGKYINRYQGIWGWRDRHITTWKADTIESVEKNASRTVSLLILRLCVAFIYDLFSYPDKWRRRVFLQSCPSKVGEFFFREWVLLIRSPPPYPLNHCSWKKIVSVYRAFGERRLFFFSFSFLPSLFSFVCVCLLRANVCFVLMTSNKPLFLENRKGLRWWRKERKKKRDLERSKTKLMDICWIRLYSLEGFNWLPERSRFT